MFEDVQCGRRTVLRGVGTVAVAGLVAGCGSRGDGGSDESPDGDSPGADSGDGAGSTETTDEDPSSEGDSSTDDRRTETPTATGTTVEAHLADTSNFEGVVDRTGTEFVTVAVGAEGNGAFFAFDPPAIRVGVGTTVTWEWTGQGAVHNVFAVEGASFESETTDAEGHTFEYTFEEPGTVLYVCVPHRGTGMKGAVVVE